MQVGKLTFKSIQKNYTLVASSVRSGTEDNNLSELIFVAKIDPALADTASFCEHYDISPSIGTNCLVLEAKRGDKVWYAACLILATDMADVNGAIRKQLDARKISFAPKDVALKLTSMEYGGVTPIGLPKDWPLLIDSAIMQHETVIAGGGVRGSKLAIKTSSFRALPNAIITNITKSK
ncbi:MAG: YbaK/EbsC family protein [Candidatus Saccharibacteria bacterium]